MQAKSIRSQLGNSQVNRYLPASCALSLGPACRSWRCTAGHSRCSPAACC